MPDAVILEAEPSELAPAGPGDPLRSEPFGWPADGRSGFPNERPGFRSSLRSLRLAFCSVGLLLGAFDAFCAPFSTGRLGQFTDASSYIDIAWAYARGDWAHALNAYWGPVYSWLLALAFALAHPSAYSELFVVHLVNLIIYAAALASFDYLWRGWMEAETGPGTRAAGGGDRETGRQGDRGTLTLSALPVSLSPRPPVPSPRPTVSLPAWALVALGYSLFVWTAIGWIGVQLVSPDLLVAALFYLAAGLMLRLRRGDHSPRTAGPASPFLLGAVLGLGFLAKAVMLPLAVVFLLLAFRPAQNPRRGALSLIAAGTAFLIVTGPFIAALSHKEGHLTLGETGRLNYAWWVNGVQQFHWRGDNSGHGKPIHPTRWIDPSPPVYEFASPIGGTYPIWTDPAYWCAGIRARFNARQQVNRVLKNLTMGRRQLPGMGPGGLVAAAMVLLLTIILAAKRRLPRGVRWDLLCIALAPAVLYSLVVVESRYLGASVVIFFLALLPAIRLPSTARARSMVVPATLLILLIPALGTARAGIRDLGRRKASRADWETATGLHALGIREGDRVACVGLSCDNCWARLARVTIVAEIPTCAEADYWKASPQAQAAVMRAFSRAGARAVVTGVPPAGTKSAFGWRQIGATKRYLFWPGTLWVRATEDRSAGLPSRTIAPGSGGQRSGSSHRTGLPADPNDDEKRLMP